MIRIKNCRECQECHVAFDGTGGGIPLDCKLERAPRPEKEIRELYALRKKEHEAIEDCFAPELIRDDTVRTIQDMEWCFLYLSESEK